MKPQGAGIQSKKSCFFEYGKRMIFFIIHGGYSGLKSCKCIGTNSVLYY